MQLELVPSRVLGTLAVLVCSAVMQGCCASGGCPHYSGRTVASEADRALPTEGQAAATGQPRDRVPPQDAEPEPAATSPAPSAGASKSPAGARIVGEGEAGLQAALAAFIAEPPARSIEEDRELEEHYQQLVDRMVTGGRFDMLEAEAFRSRNAYAHLAVEALGKWPRSDDAARVLVKVVTHTGADVSLAAQARAVWALEERLATDQPILLALATASGSIDLSARRSARGGLEDAWRAVIEELRRGAESKPTEGVYGDPAHYQRMLVQLRDLIDGKPSGVYTPRR